MRIDVIVIVKAPTRTYMTAPSEIHTLNRGKINNSLKFE